MVRVLSTVAVLACMVSAAMAQVSSTFNYSTSVCTPVLGELAFNPADYDFIIHQGQMYYSPVPANSIMLIGYTAEQDGNVATTVQTVLDDNSGANGFDPSGTVAARFGIFQEVQVGQNPGNGYDLQEPTFQLIMQTEEIVLSNPTPGVYNATLINPDGTPGTFTPVAGEQYFIAEWFNGTLNQPQDIINRISFQTNSSVYTYNSAGFPTGTITANLTYYGGYNQPTGGNPEELIALSSCAQVSGGVVGDPQFSGLLGQSYQVHGIDGAHYNLITSESTQVNARFVYLQSGACPPLPTATNCWSHPGSYLGAVGVMEMVSGQVQQLAIEAGAGARGFTNVTLNGELLAVGASLTVGTLSVRYVDSYHVTVNTAQFTISFDNSDMFINQQISSRVPLARLTSHGLLGQTHHMRRYNTAVKYIEGSVDDYSVSEDSLWGVNFPYNQFQL